MFHRSVCRTSWWRFARAVGPVVVLCVFFYKTPLFIYFDLYISVGEKCTLVPFTGTRARDTRETARAKAHRRRAPIRRLRRAHQFHRDRPRGRARHRRHRSYYAHARNRARSRDKRWNFLETFSSPLIWRRGGRCDCSFFFFKNRKTRRCVFLNRFRTGRYETLECVRNSPTDDKSDNPSPPPPIVRSPRNGVSAPPLR